MWRFTIIFTFLLVASGFAQQPTAASTTAPVAAPVTVPPKAPIAASLDQVKRVFVDSFGDDIVAKQIQAMVVTELTESQQFIVTENKERADAILRGAGLEKTSQEVHAYGESTAAGGAAGGHSGSVSGSWVGGTGSVSGSSSGGFVARHAAISDSGLNTETVNDARVAVRLVNQDGDVIWATTQESKGAKYRGASADVADEVVKQLLRDLARQRAKSNNSISSAPATSATANKN
jgi:curli biogenesis system outer membrane secretion channel CsgG